MKRVIIASQNPVKINCTTLAFQEIFPQESFEYIGIKVSSDVSDQPMDSAETLQGALNRANNARSLHPDAEFWIGLEGGVEPFQDILCSFAWIVVLRNDGKIGRGRTATFLLPPEISNLVKLGMELGNADDMVFEKQNSKHDEGAIGLLTKGAITRTTLYKDAVITALIPFIHERYY